MGNIPIFMRKIWTNMRKYGCIISDLSLIFVHIYPYFELELHIFRHICCFNMDLTAFILPIFILTASIFGAYCIWCNPYWFSCDPYWAIFAFSIWANMYTHICPYWSANMGKYGNARPVMLCRGPDHRDRAPATWKKLKWHPFRVPAGSQSELKAQPLTLV